MQARRTGSLPQLFTHAFAAVFLTLLTVVFGAPFLRVLHRSQGRLRYWLTGLAIAILFLAVRAEVLTVIIGGVWLLVGIYSELEGRGWGWKASSTIALAVGSLVGFVGFPAVLYGAGITNWERFIDLLNEKLALILPAMSDGMKPQADILAQQAPSAWVMMLALCLGTALIFEGRLFAWVGLPRERVASHLRLLEFRLPDPFIWVALTAFLVTMVDFGYPPLAIVGANVVNVCVVLYFFQGLAVMEVLLTALKAGAFLRALVYLIVVGQLFFLLSAVGLIDYWIDFRRRLRRTGAPLENDSEYGGSR